MPQATLTLKKLSGYFSIILLMVLFTGCSGPKEEVSSQVANHTQFIDGLSPSDYSYYLQSRDFVASSELVAYGKRDIGSQRWQFTKQTYYPKCTYTVRITGVSSSAIYHIFSSVECVDPGDFADITVPFQSKILQIALKDKYTPELANWLASNIQGEGSERVINEIKVQSSGLEDDSGVFNSLFITVGQEDF